MQIKKGTLISGIPYDPRRSGKVWEFIIYPESEPAGWRDNLAATGLEFCVGPVHDRDLNNEGDPKKPHRHIIVVWPNSTKWQTASALCDITAGPVCIPIANIRSKYDYLTHKNNPEKAQYDPSDIECYNGFAISKYETLNAAEVNDIKVKLTKLCRDEHIIEYSDLLFYLLDNDMTNEFDVASNHTIYFAALCKGIWRRGGYYELDPATGEVIERKKKAPTATNESADS